MAEKRREKDVKGKSRAAEGAEAPEDAMAGEDVNTDLNLDRLRAMTQGKPEDSRSLEREIFKLDASTDEEVDALKVNLFQEDERPSARDGSGLVIDEIAEQKIARFTEVGPLQGDRGAVSLSPGRDDTSAVLRRHHPNTGLARAEDVVEGNLDEPREETRMERKVDEGTAA